MKEQQFQPKITPISEGNREGYSVTAWRCECEEGHEIVIAYYWDATEEEGGGWGLEPTVTVPELMEQSGEKLSDLMVSLPIAARLLAELTVMGPPARPGVEDELIADLEEAAANFKSAQAQLGPMLAVLQAMPPDVRRSVLQMLLLLDGETPQQRASVEKASDDLRDPNNPVYRHIGG